MSQKTWSPWKNKLFEEEEQDELAGLPHEEIPTDANKFYQDFGLLVHPKTGLPVRDLAEYQLRIWNDQSKYRLVIKSQKVGISTSALLEDFQKALSTAKGKDILVIAQTQDQANEHLLTLKTLIMNSEKYRKYLITEPAEFLFKEEKTKLNTIFIKNPDNPHKRTRIIGKGPSEAALWSWKQVQHIHMSDIAANNLKDDSPTFSAAFSRLATTDGTMLIETPPRGPFKKTFEIYQQSLLGDQGVFKDLPEARFKVFHVSAQEAVKAGVIKQSFLDAERIREGPTRYAQNYECEFIAATGNLFSQKSIDTAVQNHLYNPDIYRLHTEKYIAVDQGYVTSKFAILIAEYDPRVNKVRILLAEETEMPTYEQMLNRILAYRKKYGNVQNIAIDATSRMEFAMSLKQRIDEPARWSYVKDKMAYAKKHDLNLATMMTVVPIIFSTETKDAMANHARRILDDPRELICINERFLNLITGLRSAVFDEKGMLDKDMSPHNDLTDCFMMLMQFFKFRKEK